jgi:hypothetical protein
VHVIVTYDAVLVISFILMSSLVIHALCKQNKLTYEGTRTLLWRNPYKDMIIHNTLFVSFLILYDLCRMNLHGPVQLVSLFPEST